MDGGVRAGEHREVLRAKVHGARRAPEHFGDTDLLLFAIGALPARGADVGHFLEQMARFELLLSCEKQRASLDGALARRLECLTSAGASLRGLSTVSTLLADMHRLA